MRKILTTLLLSVSYFSLATHAYAVQVGVDIPGKGNTFTYSSYISAVLSWSLQIGLMLSALMAGYAGIKYVMSQGNQTQLGEAKEILIGAAIGFTMLILIRVIMAVLSIPMA